MKSNILFSIIIPCYNCEKYIERTIKSVISQGEKNIEVILVDDGSTDNTLKLAKQILSNSKLNYNIISQKNKGVSVARNIGIKHATGEYIIFLDSDDYIDENLINELEYCIKNDNLDSIVFGYDRVNENKVIWKYSNNIDNVTNLFNGQEIVKLYLEKKIPIHLCSFAIKREILYRLKIVFRKDCYYGEDIEFLIKVLLNCERVKLVNKSLFYYYDRENSVIKKFSEKRFTGLKALKYLKIYTRNLNEINSESICELIDKRIVEEIVYVYQSYIYYYDDYKNFEMKMKIKDMINENLVLLNNFRILSKDDIEINKYIKYMKSKPIFYKILLNKKRKILRLIKKRVKNILKLK